PAHGDVRVGPADPEDAGGVVAADREGVNAGPVDGQVVGDPQLRTEPDGARDPGGEADDVRAGGVVGRLVAARSELAPLSLTFRTVNVPGKERSSSTSSRSV